MIRLLSLLLILILLQPGTILADELDDIQVAKTIAGEAIGEGYVGMYAVACVIQNRMIKSSMSKRPILRPVEVTRVGFYGKDNKVALRGYLKAKKALLKLVYTLNRLELKDITGGATHFENVEAYGRPRWSKNMIITCKIGRHTFFKIRERS